jgi:serine phosphatase RsbU (regulator of sigma subunit)
MKAIIDKALESYWADQERKSLLEQLKEANEKLEEKVAERTYELELINRKLTDSIAYARKIQKSVLPEEQLFEKYFKDAFLLYKPKDVVGGDFYALYDKGDKIIVAVGDCTGHGVPGALMSMLGISLLSSIIDYKEDHRPDLILNFVRDGVAKNLHQDENFNKDGMELGVLAYHPQKKLLEFAGSRINLLYFQDGEMFELKADKKTIGGFEEDEFHFSLQTLPIEKETRIYMFSDGFQDQFGGEHNRKIGSRQLKELIYQIHQKPMYEQKVLLEVFLRDWMNKQSNNEQMDDILVLGLKIS